MTGTREHAHHLIDLLPEPQLSGLVHLLETMIDPAIAASQSAPPEEEEIDQNEEAAVSEAHAWLQSNDGRGIPHTEAMRRLGLE